LGRSSEFKARAGVLVAADLTPAQAAALDRETVSRSAASRRGGTPASDGFEVGMMIEVPAAALKAAAFIPHVDFVSIGTNDLTQYALAAERATRQ
jgi:phosphoenolpyruvate-protein kinase (PTS system EI component)